MAILERHLNQLCQDLEINLPNAKDERQFFHFNLNPSLLIAFKDLAPGMLLFSQICSCPKDKKETLFSLLMKANFLGQGTLGATIALDPDENFLTLSWALSYDMDYRTFKETVEDFANIVDFWREEIKRHQTLNNLF